MKLVGSAALLLMILFSKLTLQGVKGQIFLMLQCEKEKCLYIFEQDFYFFSCYGESTEACVPCFGEIAAHESQLMNE